MLILGIIIAICFGISFLCKSILIFGMFIFLLCVNLILLLFGWSENAIAILWIVYFGVWLLWKYVHNKEEKELEEKRNQEINLT